MAVKLIPGVPFKGTYLNRGVIVLSEGKIPVGATILKYKAMFPTDPEASRKKRASERGRKEAQKLYSLEGKNCNRCPATADLIRHHVDRNTDNNASGNIEILCRGCHSAEHTFERTQSGHASYTEPQPTPQSLILWKFRTEDWQRSRARNTFHRSKTINRARAVRVRAQFVDRVLERVLGSYQRGPEPGGKAKVGIKSL